MAEICGTVGPFDTETLGRQRDAPGGGRRNSLTLHERCPILPVRRLADADRRRNRSGRQAFDIVMETHRGRLIDHLHLKVKDLEASKRFYKAALAALEIPLVEGEGHFFADELWVDVGPAVAHVHFAFQARAPAIAARFHAAVPAAGGRDNRA